MTTLGERVDHVIGIDSHRDAYAAASCDHNGRVRHEQVVPADAFGYRELLDAAARYAPGRRRARRQARRRPAGGRARRPAPARAPSRARRALASVSAAACPVAVPCSSARAAMLAAQTATKAENLASSVIGVFLGSERG